MPIDNVSNFRISEEEILWVGAQSEIQNQEFFFATASGLVKRVPGSEFVSNVRTIQSTKLLEGDSLIFAAPCDSMTSAVLMSKKGYFLKFPISEASLQKKNAAGVKGMALEDGDSLSGVWLLDGGREFAIDYRGGQLHLNRMKVSKRGGKGIRKT